MLAEAAPKGAHDAAAASNNRRLIYGDVSTEFTLDDAGEVLSCGNDKLHTHPRLVASSSDRGIVDIRRQRAPGVG